MSTFIPFLLFFGVQDTFRGRACECPIVNGVQLKGDGYRSCSGMPYAKDLMC